jgi:catechol 2,3-dioxygenase-like lactoylglutathione lyase family enzyme
MRRFLSLAAPVIALAVAPFALAQTRPPITGISHIAVYTTHPEQTEHFYVHDLGFKKTTDPENPAGVRYYLDSDQFVEVLPCPPNAGVDRLDHLGYLTTNAEALRAYLKAKGWTVPDTVQHASDGSRWFDVRDPENNKVQFLQPGRPVSMAGADPIGHRMIHVGMLVHSREKEDTFYRALLGFRPYWYGGMNSSKIDWVSQQVPNGRDWLEYMLTSGPSGSGIPEHMTQKALGVLDHFSIGVVNMEKAVTKLDSEGRLSANEHTGPQLGRDGKWQYNLFDPDEIRVELMEYSPVEKPCCSGFTAPNPTPPAM